VHPTLSEKPEKTTVWIPAMHSLVIGPGLGRTESFLTNLTAIISSALDNSILKKFDCEK